MSPKEEPRNFRIFYGWYVLAASFVIVFLTSGSRYTIGVVFKPLMAEFGWNRGDVSLVFFVNMTIFAISMTLAGRAYDRYGPKWVILISALFNCTGFMCISIIESLWQFFIFYGIVAALGMGGTTIPLFAALTSKWFEKYRGLALSMGLAGGCLGQFVLVPAFAVFVLRYGWRISYFWLGLIMLVVIVILTLVIIRGDPEDLGVKPFGHRNGVAPEDQMDSVSFVTYSRDLSLTEAMRTSSFWLLLTANFICGGADFLVLTHLIPMVTDFGISPITGANMMAWLGLTALAGILVAGPASDLIGARIPFAFTYFLRIFLFLLALRYQTPVAFYVFSCLFGFTLFMGAPLIPILVGRLYGFANIGLIAGFQTTVHHMGGGFWAYMGGLIFDSTGSYNLALILSAIMALIAFLSMMLMRERRHQMPQ